MSFEDTVLEYLAKAENLPFAIDVADHIRILREKLHEKFWRMYNIQMKERLLASDYGAQWEFKPFPLNRLKTDYEGTTISPKQGDDVTPPVLQVRLEQGTRNEQYRFVRGIIWTGDVGEYDHPMLRQLQADLIGRDMTYDQWRWIGGGGYHYQLHGADLMTKMYHDPEEVTAEVVDEIWGLFMDTRLQMEEINQIYAQYSIEQKGEDG